MGVTSRMQEYQAQCHGLASAEADRPRCSALSGDRLQVGLRPMHRRRAALPGCLVAALVAGGSLIAAASRADEAVAQHAAISPQPIIINSVFSNIDYRTNTAAFTDIVVSQGDRRLTAQRATATGVGFTNSQWTFAGQVVIILQPRGTLWADQAIVEFHNSELTQVTAIGSPAHFEQRRTDSGQPTQGHADRITYDAKQDTVRLYGHAQLADGRSVEISAPVLVYDVQGDRLQAESPGQRRGVHATITPDTEEGKRGSGQAAPTVPGAPPHGS